MIHARGSSRAELDLAAEILKRDPDEPAPRERESALELLNRHADAALDSAGNSAHLATRAQRRAQLAVDLGRAGVLTIDRSLLVELVDFRLQLEELRRREHGGELADTFREIEGEADHDRDGGDAELND